MRAAAVCGATAAAILVVTALITPARPFFRLRLAIGLAAILCALLGIAS